jgi:hypothetical protein
MIKSVFTVSAALVFTIGHPFSNPIRAGAPKWRFVNVETTATASSIFVRNLDGSPSPKTKTLGLDVLFGQTTKLRKLFPPGQADYLIETPGIGSYSGPLSVVKDELVNVTRYDTSPFDVPLVDVLSNTPNPNAPPPPEVLLIVLPYVKDLSPLDLVIHIPDAVYTHSYSYRDWNTLYVLPGTYGVDIIDPASPDVVQFSTDITVAPRQLNLLYLIGTRDENDAYPLGARLINKKTKL